jgi:hypothetical protein
MFSATYKPFGGPCRFSMVADPAFGPMEMNVYVPYKILSFI